LNVIWEKAKEFQTFVESKNKDFDIYTAFEIMRVNPMWFVDERALELCELYLFYRPDPSKAFPGKLGDQPNIWIQSKIILDGILATPLL
jgi:hypothetical protein